MRSLLIIVLLGACSQRQEEQSRQAAPAPLAISQPVAKQSVPMEAAMLRVPSDPAQLRRLEAMGYTVHGDHLHAPGVKSCPKESGNPVM